MRASIEEQDSDPQSQRQASALPCADRSPTSASHLLTSHSLAQLPGHSAASTRPSGHFSGDYFLTPEVGSQPKARNVILTDM